MSEDAGTSGSVRGAVSRSAGGDAKVSSGNKGVPSVQGNRDEAHQASCVMSGDVGVRKPSEGMRGHFFMCVGVCKQSRPAFKVDETADSGSATRM